MNRTIPLQALGNNLVAKSLDLNDIPCLLTLQQTIIDNLPAKHKTHITHRSAQQMNDYIQHKGCIIGLYDQGQLIASSILDLPMVKSDVDFDPKLGIVLPEEIALLRGTMVHPNYRGMGLQKNLIQIRIQHANTLGRNTLISEVDIFNVASLKSLLSQGLDIRAIGICPTDGMPSLYLFHDNRVYAPATHITFAKVGDINTIETLLLQGYVGRYINNGNIEFNKS